MPMAGKNSLPYFEGWNFSWNLKMCYLFIPQFLAELTAKRYMNEMWLEGSDIRGEKKIQFAHYAFILLVYVRRTHKQSQVNRRNDTLVTEVNVGNQHFTNSKWMYSIPVSNFRYFGQHIHFARRSRWPCRLRSGSTAARLLRLRVRIPPGT
jgi:hypothetical protein